MGIRSVLVHLDNGRNARARVAAAAALALEYEAHLIGLAPVGWVAAPADIAGAYGLAAYQTAAMQELKQQAQACASAFRTQVEQMGVLSFEERVQAGYGADSMVLAARYCDLTVVTQADPNEPFSLQSQGIAQDVLMQSGRPLLVLPCHGEITVARVRRALLGWNGSREAARALHDALPLLKRAANVEVAVFTGPGDLASDHGDIPGADIGLWLARHGVRVNVRHVATGATAGEALLLHAGDIGADLIVAGGYGHSRFREAVLGGVTRTLLRGSPVPALLSH